MSTQFENLKWVANTKSFFSFTNDVRMTVDEYDPDLPFPHQSPAIVFGRSEKEAAANAHLIAAAPDMYKALKELLQFGSALEDGADALQYPDDYLKMIEDCKSALLKAEGK